MKISLQILQICGTSGRERAYLLAAASAPHLDADLYSKNKG
jgi:hypothetical protein